MALLRKITAMPNPIIMLQTAAANMVATTTPLNAAQQVINTALEGISALRHVVEYDLPQAVELIYQCTGRIIVSGMGKSGHIGAKIAATFASTGTPAFFVHPAEASHGDLGMITPNDVLLCLSYSGETHELLPMLAYSRRFNVPLIAIVAVKNSNLARAADVALVLPPMKEACPHGLAPTTSSSMMLVLGDALAMALMTKRGFSANDFRVFHPGGKLGARLQQVGDLMHTAEALPLVSADTLMGDALITMTTHSFGCVGIVDDNKTLQGIVTDGDLRRHMGAALLQQSVASIMTKNPVTTQPTLSAMSALLLMQKHKITGLFVTDEAKRVVGFLHIHDCLRAGVA